MESAVKSGFRVNKVYGLLLYRGYECVYAGSGKIRGTETNQWIFTGTLMGIIPKEILDFILGESFANSNFLTRVYPHTKITIFLS